MFLGSVKVKKIVDMLFVLRHNVIVSSIALYCTQNHYRVRDIK